MDREIQVSTLHIISLLLPLPPLKFVYVAVRGHFLHNTFEVVIWDMIFKQDIITATVPEGITVPMVIDLVSLLQTTNVT